jgi:hypothetical protein
LYIQRLYKLPNAMRSTQGALPILSSWYQLLSPPEPPITLPLLSVVEHAMATPPPGFVRDLAGAFDQAGAPAAAPAAGAASVPPVAPAATAAATTAANLHAAAPAPLATMPPATAALFIPPTAAQAS